MTNPRIKTKPWFSNQVMGRLLLPETEMNNDQEMYAAVAAFGKAVVGFDADAGVDIKEFTPEEFEHQFCGD